MPSSDYDIPVVPRHNPGPAQRRSRGARRDTGERRCRHATSCDFPPIPPTDPSPDVQTAIAVRQSRAPPAAAPGSSRSTAAFVGWLGYWAEALCASTVTHEMRALAEYGARPWADLPPDEAPDAGRLRVGAGRDGVGTVADLAGHPDLAADRDLAADPDLAGPAPTEPDAAPPDLAGPDSVGPDSVGPDSVGLGLASSGQAVRPAVARVRGCRSGRRLDRALRGRGKHQSGMTLRKRKEAISGRSFHTPISSI